MISRRLSTVALSLLALAGCHEDPSVVAITVAPAVEALGLVATGGAASSSAGLDGTGGQGGDFKITTNGLISLGSPSFVPSVPSTPAPPTTFASTPVSPLSSTSLPFVGNILISGNVTTVNSSITVQTNSGDIVVSGTLQAGTGGATQPDIHLNAPNGTVYVSGLIRTAGDDSLSDGRSGGNLFIQAARVVITGSIDTHGVANTTALSGGNGGNVDVQSSQGPIFFTSGSIFTAGGNCVNAGNDQGGNGGSVSLNASASATNSVYVFAPITTDGGAVTGVGATPKAGDAGSISILGLNDINIVSTLSSLGGAATSTGAVTTIAGGKGGTFSVDGAATCRIYGSVSLAGGAATETGTGGTVTGGNGGSVLLGKSNRLDAVEFGTGNFSMSGGSGQKDGGTGGGKGGAVAIESFDGDISIGASLSTAGGVATGAGNSSGGNAGNMSIVTDAQAAGNLSNHTLSIPSLASLLDASGGAALGSGAGGNGGTVLLQCGGDLTSGARINASGGSSVNGVGGSATAISPPLGALDPTTAVALRVFAANLTPSGDLSVAGTIQAQGGVTAAGGTGGNGATIALFIFAGNGALTSSATLNSTGGSDIVGAGGSSGNLILSTAGGNLDLSSTLTADGADSPAGPTAAGNISVIAGGVLTSSAVLSAVGGSANDPLGVAKGMKGGAVLFNATGPIGGVTLVSGTSVTVDGGTSFSATAGIQGGAAGTITMQSKGQPISISGSLLARGGAVTGTTGTGGFGGTVIANSDSTGTGIAGSITLQSDGGIDASGGSGPFGGSALQSADPFPNATAAVVAVIFDANNNLGASGGTNPGTILNLGSITAAGGSGALVGVGGDVYFNGLNNLGVTITSIDGGTQNRTGITPGNFYPH